MHRQASWGKTRFMGKPKTKSRKFVGVYWRESDEVRHQGRPDKIFWISYRDARGKFKWERIGPASQGITEAFAHQKRVERLNLINLGENPAIKKKSKQAVLDEVFEKYAEIGELEGKHIAVERSRYGKHLKPQFGTATLPDITEEALTRHKAACMKAMAPASVKAVFALMRRVINFGIRKKMWSGSNPIGPTSDFKMPSVQNSGERFLTDEEETALLDELEKRSPMVRDMFLLALRTGLRATEIFGIRGRDVDAATNTLFLNAKGGARQSVFIDDEVLAILAGYRRRPDELIFRQEDGQRLKGIYDVFTRACNAVGLNEGITDKRQRVWFHTARHTAISRWAQSGDFSLLELKEAARHNRIETTMRYAHLIPGSVRSKIEAFAKAKQPTPSQPLRLVARKATTQDR